MTNPNFEATPSASSIRLKEIFFLDRYIENLKEANK